MKRSHWVRLAIMGSAPFTLAACDDPPTEAWIYHSVEACLKNAAVSADVCREEYLKALQNHQTVAPRYTAEPHCEADFGATHCQQITSSAGSYFIPAMAGFMIARALDNQPQPTSYYGNSGGLYMSQPLYQTHGYTNTWRTSRNDVFTGYGKTTVSSAVANPSRSAITMSRSGFGSMSAARGNWGGS